MERLKPRETGKGICGGLTWEGRGGNVCSTWDGRGRSWLEQLKKRKRIEVQLEELKLDTKENLPVMQDLVIRPNYLMRW